MLLWAHTIPKGFTNLKSILQHSSECLIIISILCMGKLRHREVTLLV